MKGYKGMCHDMTCRGFQYEIGETYTFDGKIEPCKQGFHFCKNLKDVFEFYYLCDEDNRFFEVEASGDIIEGAEKCVTSQIKIIRELSRVEVYRIKYGNGNGYGTNCGNRFGYGYGYGEHGDINGYGYGNGNSDRYGGGYGDGYGDVNSGYGDGNGYRTGYGNGDKINTQYIFLLKKEKMI